MSGKYDDIIGLPHHEPATRPRMSMAERAAQFSPFAALTGFGAVIDETARLTDERIELGESAVEDLQLALRELSERAAEQIQVTATYFEPDALKGGGAYRTHTGTLRRIDEYARTLVFTDGARVPLDDLLEIEYE